MTEAGMGEHAPGRKPGIPGGGGRHPGGGRGPPIAMNPPSGPGGRIARGPPIGMAPAVRSAHRELAANLARVRKQSAELNGQRNSVPDQLTEVAIELPGGEAVVRRGKKRACNSTIQEDSTIQRGQSGTELVCKSVVGESSGSRGAGSHLGPYDAAPLDGAAGRVGGAAASAAGSCPALDGQPAPRQPPAAAEASSAAAAHTQQR